MSAVAREEYLSNEVLSAPPQKLQLLLIEGAIRFGERAQLLWERNEDIAASEALVRCQDIVSELLAGLSPAKGTELGGKVASVYLFVFRSFMEANIRRDEKSLADALRILHEERETWRQLCAKLGTARFTAPHQEELVTAGFSLEA